MKGFQALARAVEASGSDTMFGLMGDGNMCLWHELERGGRVSVFSARHENSAVAMADGYARATGRTGLCTVTHGPGLAQTASALVTARRNRTPLVVLAGEVGRSGGGLQRLDQQRFAEACEVPAIRVAEAAGMADAFGQALRLACRRGVPVVLNLDMDAQEGNAQEGGVDTAPAAFPPLVAEAAPAPDEAELGAVAAALSAARRPVLVAGYGARAPGVREAIASLAERSSALLATSLFAKDWFAGHPRNVGLAGGFCAASTEERLREADFVLGIGARLGEYTTKRGTLFPQAEIVRIDIRPDDDGDPPGRLVLGDAGVAVAWLNGMMPEHARFGKWQAGTAAPSAGSAPAAAGWHANAGARMARSLSACLPPDAQLTVGCGHFMTDTLPFLTLGPCADLLVPCQFGAIGQALACAIGAAIGAPGRPHVLNEGDGSLLMSLHELETVVRLRLQLLVLVSNDSGYGAEVHKLRARGLDPAGARWPSPDFVAVASALGGAGVRVESPDELAPAIAAGLRHGGLFVIDIPLPPDEISAVLRRTLHGGENAIPFFDGPG